MGGHQDGVLAFGKTAEEAGKALFDLLSEALSLACGGKQERLPLGLRRVS